MTVFVTNYTAGQPKEGCMLPTDVHLASSWHRQLAPNNLGPFVFRGVSYYNLQLFFRKYPHANNLNRHQYRYNVLGWAYCKAVRDTDAFTKVCDIYDRDARLILRDRDASPWQPKWGTLQALFDDPAKSVTHSHVLAALLMDDPVCAMFKEPCSV